MNSHRPPRLRLMDEEEAKAAAREADVPEYVTALNLNRVLLHHRGMGRRFNQFFTELMFKNSLDARLRELAILRIAWLTRSVYEWTQHWRVAVGMGIAEADLVGVRRPDDHHGFSDLERAVLRAVDDVVLDGAVAGTTWDELARHLDDAQLVELLMAIGGWRMVASILTSLEVPLEDGIDPWPPDGLAPGSPA